MHDLFMQQYLEKLKKCYCGIVHYIVNKIDHPPQYHRFWTTYSQDNVECAVYTGQTNPAFTFV